MNDKPYTDQAIFDAIAAATEVAGVGIPTLVKVSVPKFIETFNNHRDRKLCTSLKTEIPNAETVAALMEAEAGGGQIVDEIPMTNNNAAVIRKVEAARQERLAEEERALIDAGSELYCAFVAQTTLTDGQVEALRAYAKASNDYFKDEW